MTVVVLMSYLVRNLTFRKFFPRGSVDSMRHVLESLGMLEKQYPAGIDKCLNQFKRPKHIPSAYFVLKSIRLKIYPNTQYTEFFPVLIFYPYGGISVLLIENCPKVLFPMSENTLKDIIDPFSVSIPPLVSIKYPRKIFDFERLREEYPQYNIAIIFKIILQNLLSLIKPQDTILPKRKNRKIFLEPISTGYVLLFVYSQDDTLVKHGVVDIKGNLIKIYLPAHPKDDKSHRRLTRYVCITLLVFSELMCGKLVVKYIQEILAQYEKALHEARTANLIGKYRKIRQEYDLIVSFYGTLMMLDMRISAFRLKIQVGFPTVSRIISKLIEEEGELEYLIETEIKKELKILKTLADIKKGEAQTVIMVILSFAMVILALLSVISSYY